MKALVVMPLAEQRGGAEQALMHLLLAGRHLGVEWRVAFLEHGPMVREVRELGVETVVIPAGRLRQPYRFVATLARLVSVARRERVDLVFGWMTKAHLYGGPAALIAGVPSAWFQLGLPSNRGWLDRVATALPARGIVVCSRVAQDAQRRLRPSRPIRVVHLGVDLERFDPRELPTPSEARRRLGLPLDRPLVGIVGRLQRWKGMHVLVAAMPRVLSHHPDAHCVVVGGRHELEPDYQSYLEGRVSALGLDRQVRLVGLQPNVPEWMQAMDVVVHASDREPFGLVIIEAMALGKPVVATETAGPAEIITSGVNGLLVPFGDPDALSTSLVRYLSDPTFAERIGSAARERAGDFSTVRYVQSLIEVIQALSGP